MRHGYPAHVLESRARCPCHTSKAERPTVVPPGVPSIWRGLDGPLVSMLVAVRAAWLQLVPPRRVHPIHMRQTRLPVPGCGAGRTPATSAGFTRTYHRRITSFQPRPMYPASSPRAASPPAWTYLSLSIPYNRPVSKQNSARYFSSFVFPEGEGLEQPGHGAAFQWTRANPSTGLRCCGYDNCRGAVAPH